MGAWWVAARLGADGAGPDSNSGTTSTTSATRITAPVKRSLARVCTSVIDFLHGLLAGDLYGAESNAWS